MLLVIAVPVLSLLSALFAGFLAKRKNRNGRRWAVTAVSLTIVGLLMLYSLLVMPRGAGGLYSLPAPCPPCQG